LDGTLTVTERPKRLAVLEFTVFGNPAVALSATAIRDRISDHGPLAVTQLGEAPNGGTAMMSDRTWSFGLYPKQTGDVGRDRNARTLQFACFLFAVGIGVVAAVDAISRERVPIPTVSVALVGLIAAALINRAGRPAWAGRIVILALLLCAVFRVRDGFRSHAMLMFPGVLLLSVMSLDRVSYLTTAGTVLRAVAALGIAEKHGLFGNIPRCALPQTTNPSFLPT
jgi:hypothetical protein